MNPPTATHSMDLDPLSYEYHQMQIQPLPYEYTIPPQIPPTSYPYSVKIEQPYYQPNNLNIAANNTNIQQQAKTEVNIDINTPNEGPTSEINTLTIQIENVTTKVEPTSETNDVKPVLPKRRKPKNAQNGQKSTYCSEKITDANFRFYGCAICDVSYSTLNELDQHVQIHENRMTSYRLRLRNQFKKKLLKKEKKRMKKMIKIKKENGELPVEIKPEDGYIGSEKASEFMNGNIEKDGGEIVGDEIKETMSASNSENVTNNESNENSINNIENKSEIKGNQNDTMNEKELNDLEKIFKCFACQKQFTLSYYLKLHVRSHTDEKPYTCAVCGQSFITASKLGRHNKRIHLAERYQCRICFKIFSRFELLTAHFDKIHAADKLEGEPYDYNAILPYLKELEEQLREQSEAKEKPSDLSLWPDGFNSMVSDNTTDVKEEKSPEDLPPKIEIIVPSDLVDVKIKQETDQNDDINDYSQNDVQNDDDFERDNVQNDSDDNDNVPLCEFSSNQVKNETDAVKNENLNDDESDDDYFPSNTWVATPKPAPSPPSSPHEKKKKSSRTCEICQKKVSSASYMRVHMRTHTGEKPFKCYTCGRGFITKSKMHRHVLTHEQDGKDVKQEDEDGQEVKQETEDQNSETGDNPEHNTKSKKKSKLKSKLSKLNGEEKPRRKHQKRPHSCEYCNQKFLHLNMLEIHKKSHEGETLIHRCNFCLQECIDETALKEHEGTHEGPKPYLCTICGRSYKKRETMIYHRKLHSPDKEYVCEVCTRRFNALCKLQKHALTHTADKFVVRYECPVCAHMFHTQYHLLMHLNTHQREGLILEENRNEILAMVLQNARKIPKTPDSSATLTDIVPSDERSRVCNICGEIFHHFYFLEEHLKSHGSKIAIEDLEKEEIKKYICQICNKGFKLHYYLKLHLFTHSKEKPFICQSCGKGFITRGKLKRHLETHSGLKKYQCHICYKFFTRPSYLRIHVRTIHGTQDYNLRLEKNIESWSNQLTTRENMC